MKPEVSVLIPVFNREHLISETLECLIAQSFSNWECIVVDDGSTDNTADVVKRYAEIDDRFIFYKRPELLKRGAASCRNYGFLQASGNYIQYLDSDDIISPNKIEVQLGALNDKLKTVATCCWTFFENTVELKNELTIECQIPSGSYMPSEIFNMMGDKNTFLPVHSYLSPVEVIKDAGLWNEGLTNNDDAEFFSRVLIQAREILVLNEATVYYRKIDTFNISSYSDALKVASAVKSWGLIEDHLKTCFGDQNLSYVNSSKTRLFRNINWENPKLISNHLSFFDKQIQNKKNEQKWKLIKQFWRRLRKRLGCYEI